MKNTNIKRILIPVDFTETSDLAITEALTIANAVDAEIYILHVVEYNEYYFSVVPETQVMLPSLITLEKAVKKKMEELREKIKKKSGLAPKVFVTTGHVHSEIIDFAEKKKIDLIIMGTHGASGYKEFFIGSNAQHVVTLSKSPVLTMCMEKSKPGFKNILIPIDASLHSREKVNLAIKIADIFKSKIHLLGLTDSKDIDEQNKINIKLDSIKKISNMHKLDHKSVVVQGTSLAKAARGYANKNKCDLIVINTGHESAITGIFLGAFAQQIVNHSKVPVLSFRHREGKHYVIETPGFGID